MSQQFASDNNAGICPEALAALTRANAEGHVPGYGDDEWTQKACARLRELFETDAPVFFVFNATAANGLALAQLCQPYHAVIAHAFSHVEEDEAGAPALFSGGAKIVTADTALAKLTPQAVDALTKKGKRGVHHVKARALSITQATELGTVYTAGEVDALTEAAQRHRLKVHMDGARLANALATLGGSPADLTWRVGVDVLCFGGVSNGVFVELPPVVQARLRENGWRFYTFLGDTGCRLMCAWDTTAETVDRFATEIAAAAIGQ